MSNARALSLCTLAFLLCGTAALAQAPATPAPDASTTTNGDAETSATAPTVSPDVRPEARPAVHTGVRIVRLSEVTGTVQMDRGNAQAFEPAFANLPIVQGARLRTVEGTAEVEFEDGSSLRLTPHTLVDFPVLSAQSDGTRATTVHVAEGSVYASLVKGKASNLTLTFQDQTLALGPAAHIVLNVSPGTPRVDVLDGTVQATRGATTQLVTKKKALLFDPAKDAPTLVSSKREESPFDAWDKRSVEYHNSFASRGQFSNSSYQYGLADLNYYGSFLGGSCSGMWRPYLVSSSWSPYSYGVWALYPGAGYSWVSPYPWGWAPYHSGAWGFCPGTGWAWSPGDQWNGLDNLTVANAARLQRFGSGQPVRPPHPPSPQGNKTLMVISEQAPVVSGANDKSDKFLFRANSAGLGVPRGVFGKLDGISHATLQHGTAERPVHLEVAPTNAAAGQRGAAQGQLNSMSPNTSATANHTSPTSMNAAHGNAGFGSHSAGMGGSGMSGGSHAGGMSGGAAPSGHH